MTRYVLQRRRGEEFLPPELYETEGRAHDFMCMQLGEAIRDGGHTTRLEFTSAVGIDKDGISHAWSIHPVKVPSEFRVDTPHGTLKAYDKDVSDYPGIVVELIGHKSAVTLAMVEYIPGGEGISDFPDNTEETRRQAAEVPDERREINNHGHVQVSAGFVTRTWPNEFHDNDRHFRTCHVGYKDA